MALFADWRGTRERVNLRLKLIFLVRIAIHHDSLFRLAFRRSPAIPCRAPFVQQ